MASQVGRSLADSPTSRLAIVSEAWSSLRDCSDCCRERLSACRKSKTKSWESCYRNFASQGRWIFPRKMSRLSLKVSEESTRGDPKISSSLSSLEIFRPGFLPNPSSWMSTGIAQAFMLLNKAHHPLLACRPSYGQHLACHKGYLISVGGFGMLLSLKLSQCHKYVWYKFYVGI